MKWSSRGVGEIPCRQVKHHILNVKKTILASSMKSVWGNDGKVLRVHGRGEPEGVRSCKTGGATTTKYLRSTDEVRALVVESEWMRTTSEY